MKKIALVSFILIVIGEFISIATQSTFLHHLCKPLIMVTLAAYYLSSVTKEERSTSLLLAIVFSFFGDTFLMYDRLNELYFMLGLVSFLISHVFYIVTYRQHRTDETETALQGVQKVRFSFPVILAGTGLVVILYPTLGDLKIPVMIYALVLVLMVINALFRYGLTTDRSFWMVLTGAILFMMSDSLLAINKFLQPLAYSSVWVMGTYIAAQFLIIEGLSGHFRKK